MPKELENRHENSTDIDKIYLTHKNFDKIAGYVKETGIVTKSGVYVNNNILNFNISLREKFNGKQFLYIKAQEADYLDFRISKSDVKLKWGYGCLVEQIKENDNGEQIYTPVQNLMELKGKSVYHLVNNWFAQILEKIEKEEEQKTKIEPFSETEYAKIRLFLKYKGKKDSIDSENLRKIKPYWFLRFLATAPNASFWLLPELPRDWVTKEDVAELMPFVNSRQPARRVVLQIHSSIPSTNLSTVGVEAIFLIRRYNGESKPPGWGDVYLDPKDQDEVAAEYLSWWRAEDVGAKHLSEQNLFPSEYREAVDAVIKELQKNNETPAEFYAQIEMDENSSMLIFHLSHQDAFKDDIFPGNPGGKCRDMYYDVNQKKVVKTLFWK